VFIVFDQWNFVKEVVKIDDYTIDIVTRAPDPAFLSRLSGTGCGVVSKAYVEANGMEHLSNNAMGTGPFIVTDYDRTSYVRMVANDDYWGGRPEIDELIFRAIPESSTRVAELLTGGVDLALSVAPQDWARIEANADLEMLHYTTDRVWG
jgi:peptide/nickel transport system substrate-binding protein